MNAVTLCSWYICRPGVPVTMQAFSEEDRKLWMEALDGKEAVSIIFKIFFYSVMGNSLTLYFLIPFIL